jgi:hypothetical protein
METRICSLCFKNLPLKDFYRRMDRGISSYRKVCRFCTLELRKNYYSINKIKILNDKRLYHFKNKKRINGRKRLYKKNIRG